MSIKTKIPPPIVALAFGFLIIYTKDAFPRIHIGMKEILGAVIIISGLIVTASAVVLFKKNKTTVTPINPFKSTKLVTGGIYKYSRNPMYLGLSFLLSGVSIIINPIGGFVLIPLFIMYLNYFQIIPEENAMTDLFEKEFLEYKKSVRRWI